jgi:hypothetical protein
MRSRLVPYLVLGSALGLLPLSTTAARPARAESPLPRFAGCMNRSPQIRPRAIIITCADGNFWADRLEWSSWNAHGAAGSGTGHENDCTPYCAAGHFHTYRVRVTLSRPSSCKPLPDLFTRVGWRFIGKKPSGSPRTGYELFPCS